MADPTSLLLRRPVGPIAGVDRDLRAVFHDSGLALVIWCQWNHTVVPLLANPTRGQVLALVDALGE